MANYTKYANGDPIVRSGGSNAAGMPAVTVFENTFDSKRRNLPADDTADLIELPAGSRVMHVATKVVEGQSGATVNVGDTSDIDAYVAGASVATTGTRAEAGGTSAGGKFYATGGTIRVGTPTGADTLETAVVKVVVTVSAMG